MKQYHSASPNRGGRRLALLLCVVGLAACDAPLAPLTPSPGPTLDRTSDNQPPTVDMGGPYTGVVGVPIQFDASKTTDADGDYLYYFWQFGDSTEFVRDTVPTYSYTYQQPGSYNVQLWVADHSDWGIAHWVSSSLTVEVTVPGATPTGTDVAVNPNDAVGLTFSNVSGEGTTTVEISNTTDGEMPTVPANFQVGSTYYNIETSATFTGTVRVCINYNPAEFTDWTQLQILHYENGEWVPLQASTNTNGHICGETTSFSPFVVAQLRYPSGGFLRPVETKDASGNYILNRVKAGSTIPVKFGLGGNWGLNIFQPGYPLSRSMPSCDGTVASETAMEAATAGKSGRSYDASTNQYIYTWQTEKGWADTCRELVIRLDDGTEHKVRFKFVR